MTKNLESDRNGSTPPSLREFQAFSGDEVKPLAGGKSVVLATGGTSRWYFLEHGDPVKGYAEPEQFIEYGRRVITRVVDIANIMFDDGVDTVFVVGFGGGQGERNIEYRQIMTWAYQLLADETTRQLYAEHKIHVRFRGDWDGLFQRLGAMDLSQQYLDLEQKTYDEHDKWLIWFVPDEIIPKSLLPLVVESVEATGNMPSRAALCEAYYGRAFEHVDIFISNNKLSIAGMRPPLMTLGDLYFTVAPTLYLSQNPWRHILYDHLFTRRGHYRDYRTLQPEVFDEMRVFYQANLDTVQGVGSYHAPSRTWRPQFWPTLEYASPPDETEDDRP